MDTKTVRIEIKFTRITLAVLLGTVLLVSGLLIARGSLAQSPEPQSETPEADEAMKGTDYDPLLEPRLPLQMNYQGLLRDEGGELVDGTHNLTFKLYRYQPVGPMELDWVAVYTETQTSIGIKQGLFNVTIGSEEPLDPADFAGPGSFGGALELGVSIDGGEELAPRAELLSVPYAFRAAYVNRFPAPHYDSDWRDLGLHPDDAVESFSHYLGGDPDDYVVDLQCKSSQGPFDCHGRASWRHLTDEEIDVWVEGGPIVQEIRVRIWRIE